MATPLVSKAPECMHCIRRMSSSLGHSLSLLASQQIRGKKTLAKVSTINVRLLQSVPSYGNAGAVVPVPPGIMRNIWYPKKMARYVKPTEIRELKKNANIERDPLWKGNAEPHRQKIEEYKERMVSFLAPEPEQPQAAPAPMPTPMEIELLDPAEATLILEKILPDNLDFYEAPIIVAPPKRVAISPSIPSTSSISAAAASGAPSKLSKVSTYGSVTINDIATKLKAILAEDIAGSRVVLAPEEISFVEETEEMDRVKHLGIFEIEIKLNGANISVQRTITVNARE